jgi:hypothetical protein
MHAQTKPADQLRDNIRSAILRCMHNSSLYKRLILATMQQGTIPQWWADTTFTYTQFPPDRDQCIQIYLRSNVLWQLAYCYGNSPAYACPLCPKHLLDSCTHIAGECAHNTSHIISRCNAACLLVHDAINYSTKGKGTLHAPKDLRLLVAQAGSQPQTSPNNIK